MMVCSIYMFQGVGHSPSSCYVFTILEDFYFLQSGGGWSSAESPILHLQPR